MELIDGVSVREILSRQGATTAEAALVVLQGSLLGGIVGTDSISYPFNEGCGTAQQYDSYVQAWIYDAAGHRSKPVAIHLVCS